MIRKLIEWLRNKRGRQAEELEYASEFDFSDDDCTNPWVCIATVDDY
jgi:hypothetical protein